MNLIMLAYVPKLDPITKDAIGWETRIAAGGREVKAPKEARFPYFGEGFVSVDQPRDSAYTADVVDATEGWGLADESGRVLGKFKTAKAAEHAKLNPKVKLEIEVESEEPVAEVAAK